MIQAINIREPSKRGVKRIYCGRPGKGTKGPLGNPFWANSEADRDLVCDEFEEWMHEAVRTQGRNSVRERDFYLALRDVYKDAKTGDVDLVCFCKPKRCHCDGIVAFIQSYLEG